MLATCAISGDVMPANAGIHATLPAAGWRGSSPRGDARQRDGTTVKFTLSWLKDHLETSASVAELTEKLSSIGLEVEGVDDPAAKLAAFTIARVLEAKRHPNADRLQVCKVDTGSGVVEVVCGAPNAKTGMIGVFAPTGSYIPGTRITLEAKPVRGVVSNGMLVSERELELSDDHEGIIELDAELGEQARPALRRRRWASPIRSST